MAEVIISGFVEWTIGRLGDAAVKEIALLWGVKDELEQLEDTISRIKSVLVDAEKKQVHDQQIKTWLMDLEDAVYDADDLANEFPAEALRRQAMGKQVRTFFSTSNPFAVRHKMGKKIRDLRKKLDAIADDKQKFHLETGRQEPEVVTGVRTSRVREDVIGRDGEKMEIIKRLLDMKTDQENINIGVIPIVGVGGLGKTTLAQLVYNDAEVRKHFETVMWVNVPKVFDVELVVKEMVKSGVKDERSMDQLEKKLEEKIKGKLYLIVLDDVWDFGNREKWLELENLLRDGAKGSKIIVTTRGKNVAYKINGQKESTHFLRTLDEEKSWSLFKKLAFIQGQEPDNLDHVKTGKEIMRKCGGIPLVIRTIASMLYAKNLEEWSSFKEKELSAIQDYHDNVIPTLKLSYDRLPSYLKHCFGYCSLFPKNYIFDVERLIDLWMAQGFIKLSNDPQENMGYQHFKNLHYRSFFDEVEIDDDSFKVTKCKMHDCMHDLAMSVTGSKCRMLSLNDKKIDKRTRHVSLDRSLWSLEEETLSLLVKMEKIRTLFFQVGWPRVRHGCSSSTRILKKLFSSCKFLRTLNLKGEGLTIIPKSIGTLKHLKYLDLSCNDMQALPKSIARLQNLQTLNLSHCEELTALPDSISRLQNLQTLNLFGCGNLKALPNDITKLVKLRNLGIKDWPGSTLSYGAHGLRLYTNPDPPHHRVHHRYLQILSIPPNTDSRFFLVFSKLENLEIENVGDLQHLPMWFKNFTSPEKLSISECSKLQSLSPGLHHLTSLERLSISNCEELDMSNGVGGDLGSLSQLRLRELPKLQHLPLWFKSLTSLKELSISFCSKLQSLSPGLHHLTSLQLLSISNCEELDMSNGVGGDLGSLSQLSLRELPKLQHLPLWFKSLTSLKELFISECSKLQSLSPGLHHLTSLQLLRISNCEELAMSNGVGGDLGSLSRLWLSELPKLQHLPAWFKSLTSLKELRISSCSKLQSLSPGLHHLTSLQELDISDCKELDMSNGDGNDAIPWPHFGSLSELWLKELPKLQHLPVWFKSLTSLKELTISECSKLQSLSPGLHHLTLLQLLSISNCEELDMSNGDVSDAILWGSLSALYLTGLPKLLHLPVWFKSLTSLAKLSIINCSKLQSLSPGLHHLSSLQLLEIHWCEELDMSNGDDDDTNMWQHLGSLSSLRLAGLPKLVALPQGLQQVTSLQEITISSCENLEAVLENITNLASLEWMTIQKCPNLKSLPEGIDCLPSLWILRIRDCPILLKRCRKDGDYWAMISHIRSLELSPMTEEEAV